MAAGLYDPRDEKDSCGVGMVADIHGNRSHGTVEKGLRVLENLAHRGAENADGRTGDGSGITIQIPHAYYVRLGIKLLEEGRYGTGIVFLPRDAGGRERCISKIGDICSDLALSILAIREVPVNHTVPRPTVPNMSSAETPFSMVPHPENFTSPGAWVRGSACATAARSPSSKASGTTAANT